MCIQKVPFLDGVFMSWVRVLWAASVRLLVGPLLDGVRNLVVGIMVVG